MSRQLKTYRSSVDPDREPIPFALEILDSRTKEVVRKEEFEAVADGGSGAVLTLAGVTQIIDGKQMVDAAALTRFFRRVLVPDSFARFQALLDDQDVGVELDVLMDIAGDLIEEYSGRPTMPRSPSSPGQRGTGDSSTVPAS